MSKKKKSSLLSDCDGELMFNSPNDNIVICMPNGIKVRISVISDNFFALNSWKIIGDESDRKIKHFSSVIINSFPTIKVII